MNEPCRQSDDNTYTASSSVSKQHWQTRDPTRIDYEELLDEAVIMAPQFGVVQHLLRDVVEQTAQPCHASKCQREKEREREREIQHCHLFAIQQSQSANTTEE
jgi:hypothetical protein